MVTLSVMVAASAVVGAGKLIVFDGANTLAAGLSEAMASQAPTFAARAAVVEPTAIPERSPSPSTEPSTTPTPTEPPAPIKDVPRFSLSTFRFSGRSYTGVVAAAPGISFVAPFAGKVEILRYQFIDSEVRVGSNVPSLPFFPYISIVTADSRMIFRPGALGSDTELVARDGDTVSQGDHLFRLITMGRSSWATFYNSAAPFQVVVSLQVVPTGRDLDPSTYIATD
ncbi:MAG TPA: hypothetical protein VGR87_11090 [Candidatus Limnocylindria bacterium]|nr:hypothetical protein [Candidatus Limnocylindria bacterium]